MIIGSGLIASSFLNSGENYDKFVIFASGVSDSLNENEDSYKREKELILKTIKEYNTNKFIYFSSVLAGIVNNNYYNHKIEVEELIKNNSSNYLIFRSPQIIGSIGNKHNLVNHIKTLILNNKEVIVYENVYRALIDVDDLVKIVNHFKDTTTCKNIYISNIEKISVMDIVNIISNHLKITPNIRVVKSENNNWVNDNDAEVNEAIDKLGIIRTEYTNNVIKKYINN